MPKRGWADKKNGELLEAAGKEFEAFVTSDRSIPHEPNLSRFDLTVMILEAKSNSYEDLASLMDRTNAALGEVVPGRSHPLSCLSRFYQRRLLPLPRKDDRSPTVTEEGRVENGKT